jgi:hypothetical protein
MPQQFFTQTRIAFSNIPVLNKSLSGVDVWWSGGTRITPLFLTSTFDDGEWSASRRGTHCIGGWMGHRIGLDIIVERKIPCPCQQSKLDSLVAQPIA